MSLFSKLFGGGKPAEDDAAKGEEYKGFIVTPTPIREGSKYRLSARIDKEVDGEALTHTLIRADVMDKDDAVEASLRKAKQMIDEQGERLFR